MSKGFKAIVRIIIYSIIGLFAFSIIYSRIQFNRENDEDLLERPYYFMIDGEKVKMTNSEHNAYWEQKHQVTKLENEQKKRERKEAIESTRRELDNNNVIKGAEIDYRHGQLLSDHATIVSKRDIAAIMERVIRNPNETARDYDKRKYRYRKELNEYDDALIDYMKQYASYSKEYELILYRKNLIRKITALCEKPGVEECKEILSAAPVKIPSIPNRPRLGGEVSKLLSQNLSAQHLDADYIKFIEQLFKDAIDLNLPNERGFTVLIVAAANGDLDEVRRLIKQGADVNYKNSNGRTALTEAASGGHSHIITELVSLGTELESKDKDGQTALFYASVAFPHTDDIALLYSRLDAIRTLVNCGANIEATDNDGETPLLHAFNFHNPAAVVTLVDLGANLLATNKFGSSALVYVANTHKADPPLTLMAMQGIWDIHGDKMIEVIERHDYLTAYLIYMGLDPRNDKSNPLHYTVSANRYDVALTLIANGADINATNSVGRSFINVAQNSGRQEFIDLVLNTRSLDTMSQSSINALVNSIDRGNMDLAISFLDKGTNINGQEQFQKRTALMAAAETGNIGAVKILLKRGANPNIKDKQGRTAAFYARRIGNKKIARLLEINPVH